MAEVRFWTGLIFRKILLLQLCCLAFALATPTAAATNTTMDLDNWWKADECPAWLMKYKTFHDQNKNKSDAGYIVYWCTGDSSCSGLGDRLRGIMFLLRVAYVFNKVLLIHMDQPVNLQEFLKPHLIDWRIETGLPPNLNLASYPINAGPMWTAVNKGDSAALNATKVVKVILNEFYDQPIAGMNKTDVTPQLPNPHLSWIDDDTPTYIASGVCLFHFLFVINEKVKLRAMENTVKLYGKYPADYVAWHWRSGGQIGEEWDVLHSDEFSRMSQIMLCTRCLQDLSKQFNMDLNKMPGLLVTDVNPVRRYVAEGNLRKLVATNDSAIMIDRVHHKELALYMPIFVDIVMLSRAKCVINSRSGISMTGGFIGNYRCIKKHEECLRQYKPSLNGIVV